MTALTKDRNYYDALRVCRNTLDLSYREIGEMTGASHTQVQRWMDSDHEAQPNGLQEAVLIGICDWNDRYTGGKTRLLRLLRKRGHHSFLKKIMVT